MYLYNEFIINILNDINTLSCPSKSNSKRIERTVHTSCYWGLRLTLCYLFLDTLIMSMCLFGHKKVNISLLGAMFVFSFSLSR